MYFIQHIFLCLNLGAFSLGASTDLFNEYIFIYTK